jgi:hypothetical protein
VNPMLGLDDDEADPLALQRLQALFLRGQPAAAQPAGDDSTDYAKALAEHLRTQGHMLDQAQAQHDDSSARQYAFGNLGILSGDPVLSKFGQAQLSDIKAFNPTSLRGLTLQQGAERLALQQAEALRKTKLYRDKLGQDQANKEADRALRARQVATEEQKVAQTADKKQKITGTEAQGLADFQTALDAVDRLSAAHASAGAGGLSGYLLGIAGDKTGGLIGGKVKEFNDLALATQQAVGKILEGGKLAAGDEVKYRKMLPKAGDSAEVVRNKAEALKTLLNDSYRNRVTFLRRSNFDTSGFDDGVAPPPVPITTPVAEPDMSSLQSRMAPIPTKPDVDLTAPPPQKRPAKEKPTKEPELPKDDTRFVPMDEEPPPSAAEASAAIAKARAAKAAAALPSTKPGPGESMQDAWARLHPNSPPLAAIRKVDVSKLPPGGLIKSLIDGEYVKVYGDRVWQRQGNKIVHVLMTASDKE